MTRYRYPYKYKIGDKVRCSRKLRTNAGREFDLGTVFVVSRRFKGYELKLLCEDSIAIKRVDNFDVEPAYPKIDYDEKYDAV